MYVKNSIGTSSIWNNVIFKDNLFLFQLLYKLEFNEILRKGLSHLSEIREIAYDCGSFKIYLFLVDEEKTLKQPKTKLLTETIDVQETLSQYPDNIEQNEPNQTQQKTSHQNETFLHKLKRLNSRLRLSTVWNILWCLITLLSIYLVGEKDDLAVFLVSLLVLFVTNLPCVIFWNTCDVKKLLKKKKTNTRESLELDDSLNVSQDFNSANDKQRLTVDGPSSTVKIKNLKFASVYNKGGHYIDYNKQRCKRF